MATRGDLLRDYKAKRDFSRTREPSGAKKPSKHPAKKVGELRYLIQKHAATRLHYDFRLELDGVLKSWAVTKGPSLDPRDRRLAVHVEDHPLDYGDFEGTIPKGQYGGGTVMLWDTGTWEPDHDPHKGLKKGHLDFHLHGERLKGSWHLVRMRGRPGEKRENWLLIKGRDGEADERTDPTEEYDTSVVSGRPMGAIAEGEDVWNSNRGGQKGGRTKVKKARTRTVKGRGRLPSFVPPVLATLVDEVPPGDDWVHEMKYDGYRCLAAIDGSNVKLWTRNQQDWTDRFARLVDPIRALGIKNALIDGEVVALDAKGKSDFSTLQNALNTGHALAYCVFDLLTENGKDLRNLPLVERKERLKTLVGKTDGSSAVLYSEHIVGQGEALYKEICRKGFEGMVSKRADSRYVSGRGRDWIKVKCNRRQEFVLGGWQESDKRRGFRSLLLGLHEGKDFKYVGKVGTGFNDALLRSLGAKLEKLEIDTSPFTSGTKPERKGVHWAKPQLVAEIDFTEFTGDGHLRHPSFVALREDKPAREVKEEKPVPIEEVQAAPRKKGAKPRAGKPRDEDTFEGVRVTHPDKVLYPDMGLTKRDLIDYYRAVEKLMMPYLENRLLSLVRCPEGSAKKCFYQKHAHDGFPTEFKALEIEENNGGRAEYLYIDNLAGLVAGVQVGTLEFHVWGSEIGDIERPTRLVFDFDPDPGLGFDAVKKAAKTLRGFLDELGLESFPMLSGGKGVHVVVPIRPSVEWPQAKAFCRAIAEAMESAEPDKYVVNMSKAKRKGRIFVDYLRNDRGSTAVAPYSTRAKPGATVGAPVTWEELARTKSATAYDIRKMAKRKTDPWKGYFKVKQSLTPALLKAAGVEA